MARTAPPPPAPVRRGSRLMPLRLLAVALVGLLAFMYAPASPLAKAMPQGRAGWPCKTLHVNCGPSAKKAPARKPAPHRTPERQP